MTESMVYSSLAVVGVLALLLGVLRLRHVSLQSLILGLVGAILGLLFGALASVPLSKLGPPLGSVLPITVTALSVIILMGVVLSRRHALLQLPPILKLKSHDPATKAPDAPGPDGDVTAEAAPIKTELPQILVDTSVIIDGRIADIAAAGFVPGRLVVPRFVLAELQNIADSDNAMRRGRGRRGLDVLNRLRETEGIQVDIIEDDAAGIREVDAKLVALAQRFSCNVLTTDYNLNRVAQIQGVRVLNVNELSNAIRPVVLPGEELAVTVVQPGKERNQGVGYLADGTMIVVENGDKMIGQQVMTEVTRVFQTVAGKMIFAAPKGKSGTEAVAAAKAAAASNAASSAASNVSSGAPSAAAPEPAAAKPVDEPVVQAEALVTDPAAAKGRKARFGRGKRHGSGNGNSTSNGNGGSNPSAITGGPTNRSSGSVEDRIIAATSRDVQPQTQRAPRQS